MAALSEEITHCSKKVCVKSKFAWCKTCQISVCKHCLQDAHKQCDWILVEKNKQCDWIPVEKKIGKLKYEFRTIMKSTSKDLTDLCLQGKADNTANLSKVRGIIKSLQEYEKYFASLEISISIEKDAVMNRLNEIKKLPAIASAEDYTTAISQATSLLHDFIQYPNILDFSFLFHSKDSAVPENFEMKPFAMVKVKDECQDVEDFPLLFQFGESAEPETFEMNPFAYLNTEDVSVKTNQVSFNRYN